MKIGGTDIYMGAYAKRQQEAYGVERKLSKERVEAVGKEIQNAFKAINASDRGVTLSVSQDTIDFLSSSEGFNRMKKDAEDIYIANLRQQQKISNGQSPDDKFWNSTGDQWLVFSEALDKGGFYDKLSNEEVLEFEGLLEKVTSSMDNLSKSQFNTGIDFGQERSNGKFFMSSAEATIALESSIAALHYMSDNIVPDSLRDEFNNLIDMYEKHNTDILSEYKSPVESINKAIAAINKAGGGHPSPKPVIEYKYTVMLGEIEYDEEKKNDYRTAVSNIFKSIMMTGHSENAIEMLKSQFEKYVTNNSEDDEFKQYVVNDANYLFTNIKDYWDRLIDM